jgi:hypothetical protein
MIIRSGLHCQRMEKPRSALLSDEGGAFTAVAVDSAETSNALAPARRMAGMGHPEFGHVGAFAPPGRFAHAMCAGLGSRSLRAPRSLSIQASVVQASLVDKPYAYNELPACPDRVESAPGERMTLAFRSSDAEERIGV